MLADWHRDKGRISVFTLRSVTTQIDMDGWMVFLCMCVDTFSAVCVCRCNHMVCFFSLVVCVCPHMRMFLYVSGNVYGCVCMCVCRCVCGCMNVFLCLNSKADIVLKAGPQKTLLRTLCNTPW